MFSLSAPGRVALLLLVFCCLMPVRLCEMLTRTPVDTGGRIHHVLAIGKTNNNRLLVFAGPPDRTLTSSYPLVYNLSADALDDVRGQLLLNNWPVQMPDLWKGLPSKFPWTLRMKIRNSMTYVDAKDNQLYLMLDFDYNGQHDLILVNLYSTTAIHFYTNDVCGGDFAIVSTSEPLTYYRIEKGLVDAGVIAGDPPMATRIAKASITLYSIQESNMSIIVKSKQVTNYATVCRSSPNPDNRMIYLSLEDNCPHPVHWPVTTGYVDKNKFILVGKGTVYIFDRSLFVQTGKRGPYQERTFEDFFYTNHPLPGAKLPKWAIISIVLSAVAITAVLLGVVVYLVGGCGQGQATTAAGQESQSSEPGGSVSDGKEAAYGKEMKPTPKMGKLKKQPKMHLKQTPASGKKSTNKKKTVSKKSRPKSASKKSKNRSKKSKKSKRSATKSKKTKKSAKKSTKKKGASNLLPASLSDNHKLPSLKTNEDSVLKRSKKSGKSRSSKGKAKMSTGKQLAKGLAKVAGASFKVKKTKDLASFGSKVPEQDGSMPELEN